MKTPVYFISDIHLKLDLNNDERERRKKLYHLLNQIQRTGGTCFFLGDLFDFYFEYPDLIPKCYLDFYDKAKQLRENGVQLHFLAGNHDYWVGAHIKNTVMDKVYLRDKKIEINGKKFYLTHGDGLLSWDHGYRLLKKIIRSRLFIWILRILHPSIAFKIASFITKSGKRNDYNADFNKDVRIELQNIAKKHFDNGFDFMISGHYHLGEMFSLKKGKLAILGDWFYRPSYVIFDGNDIKLILLEQNA